MINFKNVAENLIYIIVTALVSGAIGYFSAVNAIGSQREIIEQAIAKETTSIINRIDKIKTTKGTTVTDITSDITQAKDSVKVKKRGFLWFGR